jgi:hypothetical protein
MNHLEKLGTEVTTWPNVSIHPHRFGGSEFRFGAAEVGHTHIGGVVDIPFPRPVRDALLSNGLAEEHRWVPNSGWITFQMRTADDLSHALWLMRLSWLRYALKRSANPGELLEQQSETLGLTSEFRTLFEPFVLKTANHFPPTLIET